MQNCRVLSRDENNSKIRVETIAYGWVVQLDMHHTTLLVSRGNDKYVMGLGLQA